MPSPLARTSRILAYGLDVVLLNTRQMLLDGAGYEADAVSSAIEFQDSIDRADPSYSLLVLCHTVPAEEQRAITAAVSGSETSVYGLDGSVAPDEFLKNVRLLLTD